MRVSEGGSKQSNLGQVFRKNQGATRIRFIMDRLKGDRTGTPWDKETRVEKNSRMKQTSLSPSPKHHNHMKDFPEQIYAEADDTVWIRDGDRFA